MVTDVIWPAILAVITNIWFVISRERFVSCLVSDAYLFLWTSFQVFSATISCWAIIHCMYDLIFFLLKKRIAKDPHQSVFVFKSIFVFKLYVEF